MRGKIQQNDSRSVKFADRSIFTLRRGNCERAWAPTCERALADATFFLLAASAEASALRTASCASRRTRSITSLMRSLEAAAAREC